MYRRGSTKDPCETLTAGDSTLHKDIVEIWGKLPADFLSDELSKRATFSVIYMESNGGVHDCVDRLLKNSSKDFHEKVDIFGNLIILNKIRKLGGRFSLEI